MIYDTIRDGNGNYIQFNGRSIIFPHTRKFASLFPTAELYKPSPTRKESLVMNMPCGKGSKCARCRVSSHMRIELHTKDNREINFVSVSIANPLREWIKKGVLRITHDTMNFQINIWPDGNALVILSHGQSIGNHYIAVLDSRTVPFVHTKEEEELCLSTVR